MDGRVALVTGATSGLGLATATGLARLGATVRMLARSADRAEHARAEVVERTGNRRRGGAVRPQRSRRHPPVRGRVPRAGASPGRAGQQRRCPPRGAHCDRGRPRADVRHERRRSVPDDATAAPAASQQHPVADRQRHLRRHVHAAPARRRPADGARGGRRRRPRTRARSAPRWCLPSYGRSDSRARASSYTPCIRAGPTLPGYGHPCPTFHRLSRPLLRTPEQGADTIVWLSAAAEPARSTGGFWHDRRRRPTHRVPWTRESADERQALWTACERLTSDDRGAT